MIGHVLHAAFTYAARGWHVLPLFSVVNGRCTCWAHDSCRSPGKHPLTAHGRAVGATPDKVELREHFACDVNVGLACGQRSAIAVVDVDPRNGGNESLADLLAEHGQFPDTAEVATGGGGRHFYFACSQKVPKRELAPGVDLLGDGANVCAPPSLHVSGGRYEWVRSPDDVSLAGLPAWITPKAAQRRQTRETATNAVTKGRRNGTLTTLAGRLRAAGNDEVAIKVALLAANLDRCDPPLPEPEVASIARSVARYPAELPLTESGNAERLVRDHGTDLKYCFAWRRWLFWDDRRWTRDAQAQILGRSKLVARSLYTEASACEDEEHRKAIAKWARASESAKSRKAMIELATAEEGIPVTPDDLDRDPWLLNAENGTVDLRTGELRPPKRTDLLTKLAPVKYDSKASAPTFKKFLNDCMDGSEDLIAFLQRALGYAVTGEVSEDALLFFYGAGCNGKSTFLNVVSETLGIDYAHEAVPDLLLQKKRDHLTELADLHGRRLVTTTETGDGARFAEVLVKRLTGRDPITARRMREDPWQFMPTFTLIVSGNHKPAIRGTDDAIWRRIHLVPFNVSFKGREDRRLPDRLRRELPGILAWLVRGSLMWQAEGLNPPDEVLVAGAEYRRESDVLVDFLAEKCVTGDHCRAKGGALYDAYLEWHKGAVGGEPLNNTAFGLELKQRGFSSKHRSDGSWRLGIGLRLEVTR